jgi:hypothetical protein
MTLNGKVFHLDATKILINLRKWSSSSVMWGKPINAAGNLVHALSISAKEGLNTSIRKYAKGFINPDDDWVSFTNADLALGIKEAVKVGTDFIKGNYKENKLWLLAKQIAFLPEDSTFYLKRYQELHRNKITDVSIGFLPFEGSELLISYAVLYAQMRHAKNPNTGKSIWESYTVENGY